MKDTDFTEETKSPEKLPAVDQSERKSQDTSNIGQALAQAGSQKNVLGKPEGTPQNKQMKRMCLQKLRAGGLHLTKELLCLSQNRL